MGITDWWLISVTNGFDQPDGDNLKPTPSRLETQFQR